MKKNARYQTRKEIEAFYQGRDSRPEPRIEADGTKPPERGDYGTYEDFLDAKAAFMGGKAAQEERARIDEQTMEAKFIEEQQKIFDGFRSKTQEKYPDLEERLEEISDVVMPAGMGRAIAESDVGPDILDFFARNPKDCKRIAALSPSSAVREIGKLEAKLEAKPEPKRQAPSALPSPIKPGSGNESATPKKLIEISSQEEFEKRRRAQIAARH